jgi:uncharacterized protein (DUF924 family)
MNVPQTAPASTGDYVALDPRARDVLECWFGAPDAPDFGTERKSWFKRSEAFDAMLQARFAALIGEVRQGALDSWTETPLGALALVIVLDQFSRNCHRGTPHAFAGDAKALSIAQQMVASGADLLLPSVYHRVFVYMPFEHDESMDSQRESLRLFKALDDEVRGIDYYRFAERHAEVIERFGRFPHRNALLGRPSTAEEIAFLRQPGSSF